MPGLQLPGLDISSLAAGFGCRTATVESTDMLEAEFKTALQAAGPTVLVVPTLPQLPQLG